MAEVPDETVDFIVVGSGGGSMCAALYLRSVGKAPLVLEKTDLFGGTTARSGGVMWIPNNRFLRKDGIDDSTEKAMTYLDQVVGDDADMPGATRIRRLAYVTEAPRMIDFLIDQGIKLHRFRHWPDYYDDLAGGLPSGRSVGPVLFNANALGVKRGLLRPNYSPVAAHTAVAMKVPLMRTTWAGKIAMLRIATRTVLSKLFRQNWVGRGAALQGRMLHACLAAGVDMRTNAPVERLLTDAEGAVTGVIARIGGRPHRLIARHGVLVNAGGFARNQAMRNIYQPGASADWSNAIPGDTGEMIEEMIRVGAAVAQMEQMVGNPMALPPTGGEIHPMIHPELGKPHALVVDQTGVRYAREAQSYMSFCQAMVERNRIAPAVPSWLVMDRRYLARYMVAGSLPGSRKPDSWYESGFLMKAATIEDLADACGIDPARLSATVGRFNDLVRAGRDEDFSRGDRAYDRFLGDSAHRPSPTLGTVEQGPFYAYRIYPGDVGTFGGVVTDRHARVLRDDGTPIPGLYATGTSTASVMGKAYPGAGSSVGPSFTWGFVAARHAAEMAAASPDPVTRPGAEGIAARPR